MQQQAGNTGWKDSKSSTKPSMHHYPHKVLHFAALCALTAHDFCEEYLQGISSLHAPC
jgi:hypothetical protein